MSTIARRRDKIGYGAKILLPQQMMTLLVLASNDCRPCNKDALYALRKRHQVKQQKLEPNTKFFKSMVVTRYMGIVGAVLSLIHAMSLLNRPTY